MRGGPNWWDRKKSPGTRQDCSWAAEARADITTRKFIERVYDETLKRLEPINKDGVQMSNEELRLKQ